MDDLVEIDIIPQLTTEELLKELLFLCRNATFPGKGKEHAKLVRKICDTTGWEEDNFLDNFVIRDKAKWGLEVRS